MTGVPVYPLVAKHVLAPTFDRLRGTATMRCLAELEQSQWWRHDKIMELQARRLQALVTHAYENVPYYQRVFDERQLRPHHIRTPEDLAKLPEMTKALMRSNSADLVARGARQKELLRRSTGGSTGEPLSFYRTKRDFFGWGSAAELRAYGWAGYRVGEKCALVWERYPYASPMDRVLRSLRHRLQRIVGIDAVGMSPETLPSCMRILERLQGGFIRGYPTAIYTLARFVEARGNLTIRPRAVITSGEDLYDFQRGLFSKIFGCETYSHYGSNEAHAIASECSEHSGYHISAENVIVEIVDDDGRPVPAGKEGRILVTNLHNLAMPFLRYETGDVGILSPDACRCGRGLPIMAKINGRTADVIVTASGKSIPGVALAWNFLASLGVEQFQIVQESYENVTVRLVLDRESRQENVEGTVNAVLSEFGSILGAELDIAVEVVDEIEPSASGKRRFVLSNIQQDLSS